MNDFDKVNQAALFDIKNILPKIISGGRFEGDEYTALNPRRNDKHIGSFRVNTKTGVWKDFATNDAGNGIISLYSFIKAIKPREALVELAKETRVDLIYSGNKDNGTAIIPIPEEAFKNIPTHPKLGKPTSTYAYKTIDGKISFINCRFKDKTGNKTDRPLSYRRLGNGKCRWAYKSLNSPRPLYNLDQIAKNDGRPILICEGEKATEAASRLFPEYVCSTSPNGSKSARSADWSLCKDRDIIIWPDNDMGGFKYAQDVSELAKSIGAISTRIVEIPQHFPEKWDLADALPEGVSLDDIKAMIQSSVEVQKDFAVDSDFLNKISKDEYSIFKSENIQNLAELKAKDPCEFQKTRALLKKHKNINIQEVDRYIKDKEKQDNPERSPAEILIDICSKNAYLFHTPNRKAFADIMGENLRCKTVKIRSDDFKQWLLYKYFNLVNKKTPNSEAIGSAINSIESQALYSKNVHETYLRTATQDGKSYIDLCNENLDVVEIDKNGWRIINDPPVKFLTVKGMLPLPRPEENTDISILRPFLNIKDDNSFILICSWLISALSYPGPYPILVVTGEQGSSKTSFCELIRKIIDPNGAPLRSWTKDMRDLFISAYSSNVLAYDNVSRISGSISDALCCISTGGGYATRKLYTDEEETVFEVMRPIILNGIENIITRADLADRSIFISLKHINEKERKYKSEIEKEFKEALPQILGALFSGISYGLSKLEYTKLDNVPRLADFARFSTAVESFFFNEGDFMKAYIKNKIDMAEESIENSTLAKAINDLLENKSLCKHIDGRTVWTGSASDFLSIFEGNIEYTKALDWPKSPEALGNQIRRISPNFRLIDTIIDFDIRESKHDRKRLIRISRADTVQTVQRFI